MVVLAAGAKGEEVVGCLGYGSAEYFNLEVTEIGVKLPLNKLLIKFVVVGGLIRTVTDMLGENHAALSLG